MQTTQLADLLDSRPKVEMVSVAQKNLDSEFFENVLRNAFDRGQRAYGHKDRGFDLAMRCKQTAGARRAGGDFNFELHGHC